ncbi:MAG: hypothetical protein EA396_14475 [Anaerolineaceae bacterium]|nr:MAG: hypothetical protein EA396_14475 [Anaerolineaceae bacterium]
MAKKRQSTGLPKPRDNQPQQPESNGEAVQGEKKLTPAASKEQKSRREQEQETMRNVLFWSVVFLVGVAALIGVVFVVDQVINPRRTVANVNDQSISVAEFQTRVRIERALINEEVSITVSPLISLGLVADPNDAINQLYQFDPEFRQLIDDLGASDRLGLRVLNTMIDDRLIEQEAERLGVSVTDEEIDEAIKRFLQIGEFEEDPADLLDVEDPLPVGVDDIDEAFEGEEGEEAEEPVIDATPTPLVSPTPSPEPTQTPEPEISPTPSLTPFPSPTPTERPSAEERQQAVNDQLALFYRNVGIDANVSRNDIREVFRIRALRDKLAREVLDVPEAAIWVNSRHILVSTESEAQDIIEALNNGESFAAIARVSSQDTGSGANGGELNWVNSYNFVAGFREAVREQPVGAISEEPVQTDFGFHIIQVREREERDIEDAEVSAVLEEGFSEWLREFRSQPDNEISTSDIWPDVVPQEPGFTFRQR